MKPATSKGVAEPCFAAIYRRYNVLMAKNKITQKWSEADRFAFSTSRLRASTMPNKKALARKKACRGQADF